VLAVHAVDAAGRAVRADQHHRLAVAAAAGGGGGRGGGGVDGGEEGGEGGLAVALFDALVVGVDLLGGGVSGVCGCGCGWCVLGVCVGRGACM